MTYIPEEAQVVYRSKDGKNEKTFDALEWQAAMCSHVPNNGEQMVRYYGYYSNISRGRHKQRNEDEWISYIMEAEGSSKECRKNWARFTRLWRAYPADLCQRDRLQQQIAREKDQRATFHYDTD